MMYRAALGVALAAALTSPALARSTIDTDHGAGGGSASGYLQCVPYARGLTGIRIHGDAHTWWNKAEGRYARGSRPKVGAVMAIQPHGNSRLGHVAAVSEIVDDRTVLISHANWSAPGAIENNVKAVDVSPANDWSEVRVWYGPSQALGANRWPVYGFIYKEAPERIQRTDRTGTEPRTTRQRDPIGAIIAHGRR